MSHSLNRVMLIGNLGSDPEIRATPNGSQVANFRVACAESWKDQAGQKRERTEWVTCVAWRAQAEIAQRYLRKGSKLYVEGRLQTRTWEDKNGGGKRYATEVLVERIMMLDGRPSESGGNGSGNRGGSTYGGDDLPNMPAGVTPGEDDNDLPF